ncbi:MAG: peptidylprolyl isomerase, partial [Clostridiales Family XIII bacterium]|nr:peptidylprolyl isomerase [Clostridiales Family XIII bacterium]
MNRIVRIEMENGDVMRAELYPDVAPSTVENFVRLVESGFYDGTEFHRIIPGFMIQGGAGVNGSAAMPIAGEFTENGFRNDLAHDRGVLSMARTSDPNSASSQFFIMVDKAPHLDGKYAAFGKV